ncbi:unnamed protein product [Owenia fusiformis]|uniref:b(0,+)-type amino acid transporter 1 n=1 Tax=Owenia fusiformis TaxID=6347 RepID=A0A8J1XTQ1_OWEFU|nr:unnamed protein product [Owenia fusiformis]
MDQRKSYISDGMTSEDGSSARQRPPSQALSDTPTYEGYSNGSLKPGESEVTLKRHVGLMGGVSLIVGTMIGSGIFISPKGVLEGTGSVGLSLIVWSLAGVLSMLGALAYAELGTFIPKSGAEYVYLLEGFGSRNERIGGIPAFLFQWVSTLLLKPSSFAIITLAFASYTLEPFFPACGPPEVMLKCLAAVAILVITAINCWSVRLATGVQVFFTGAKLVAMAVIIIGGIAMLAKGNTQYLTNSFEGTTNNFGTIAIGFYNGLWAYDGWNNLNYVTEELKNPYVNLPRSIMIAIPLVTICYLLVNISYFTVMGSSELLASGAVAVTWGDQVLGVMAWLIPLSVAFSTFGAANGSLFSSGRLCYVAAREGHMVEILSMVNVRRLTPLPSLVFTAIIALIMIIPGDIGSLIDFFSFTAWLFYGGTMLALIVMRFTHSDEPRPYQVPIVIPIIVLIFSLYLIVAPIINKPQIEFLYAALFVVGGLIFYFPFVYFKLRPGCMDGFTAFFQLLMECSPSEYEPES